MATTQQYSLRWNNYFRHLTYALDNHRTNDDFVDVSLCCDGRKIKAHKVVLSSCSTYFKEIFKENPHPHPVIIFKFIKYEDLNSIVEFMYQGEVNVHQDALQSFLQTAELLAVQGLTAEEKEKPKAPPTPIIEEHKLIKTIPSTIRTIDTPSVQATTQTIEIPTATILQQVPQLQQQQQQTQTAQSGGSQPQQQHHHVQTQIQHIQIHSQPQQVQQATHQLQQQQQQAAQQQQTQQSQHLTGTGTNTVTLPVVSTAKKRKITFSDDEDIYTTETVNYVKDEQTIVKTSEMTFLRSEVKMDMPEYIVSEVEDDTEQLTEDTGQQSSQDVTVGGQGVTQYTSEYEILTESELEEKYHQGDSDNTEITIEMSRLLNTGSNSNEEASDETGNAALSSANGSKVDKNSTNADGMSCKLCGRRMQTANALRRHMTSKHSDISGKDYECTQCSKSFKTKWSLSTHNSRFHRDVRGSKECVRMETF